MRARRCRCALAAAAAALAAALPRGAAQPQAGPPPDVFLLSFQLNDGSQSMRYPGGAAENHCFFDSDGDGVVDYVNGQYGMFGYFEGWVRGNAAYVSWWEVTIAGLAGAVIPTSGAAALTYSFDPTVPNLDWSAVSGATVTGPYWAAGATTMAGPLGVWNAGGGAPNATLAATPEVSCLYSAPNQAGNNPLDPAAQFYWSPFWDTKAVASYATADGRERRTFCSDAHTQPPDLVFTSSAQSNYGAVLGSYAKRNLAGVDCGPNATQAVGCPTSGFDTPELGYYGAGSIPFSGAVSYGLVGTGQALTGPFAGRANDGGSFTFVLIEAVNTSAVGTPSPDESALSLKGFKCLVAGTAEGGDAYRLSCAAELLSGRRRGSVTACLQPYALTPFTNTLCVQSNARGRPLGYPLPTTFASAGFGAANAAGTAVGGGYVPSAGSAGRRRRQLRGENAAAAAGAAHGAAAAQRGALRPHADAAHEGVR